MAHGASREAVRTLTLLLVAGIACAQVQQYDGAGLGSAYGQPAVLSGQQPVYLQQQQPVSFQQQPVSFQQEQQEQQPLSGQSFESGNPYASVQQQPVRHHHHHSYQAEDPMASLQQLQQPSGSYSLQEQPTAALQQEQPLGISSLQGSSYPLTSQGSSMPLQQAPVLAAQPSAVTVLPTQPTASVGAGNAAQLQEAPMNALEEADLESAALAQSMFQGIGEALTQPSTGGVRAGLQRQRTGTLEGGSEGGGILEELAKLVAEAIFLGAGAPALAPGPAEASAVAGTPSVELPQAFGGQQAPGPSVSTSEPDDITVVKVQQSLADPDVERVQVVSLKKIAPESEASFEAEAPAPQVHTRVTSAAMRATAQQAQAQPTAQNFQAEPRMAGQKKFEAKAAKELSRLASAPAGAYEEIDADNMAPAAGQQPMQTSASPQAPAPVQAALQSAPRAPAMQSNALQSHNVPGVSFISNRGARRALRAEGGTHPAVIWQSHLLDVTPQQWNNLKSSYTSGIAQGANVGKNQVIILGVTYGTSVTVNTQIIYYNDDSSAAGELKNSLADQQSGPVYIPNFGNVQVTGVTLANVPIATPTPTATAAASANYAAYTPASFSAPGPSGEAATAPGQQTAPAQQLVTPVAQSAQDSSVAPVLTSQQLYKNNGLPVGAAIGVPIGAVALAAALLYMAHLNRQRTSRLIQEYTEPMIRKDADSAPGSLSQQAASPPRRVSPSPKVSPKISPRSPSKVPPV